MSPSSSLSCSSSTSLTPSLQVPLVTSFHSSTSYWWPHSSSSSSSASSSSSSIKPKVFLLFIPGNPGVASYYVPYLSALYHSPELRGKVEILAVGHRGHVAPPSGIDFEEASAQFRREDVGLKAQIEHKVKAVEAIRRVYPKQRANKNGQAENGRSDDNDHDDDDDDVKLILIGHSLGAYIGLKVLERKKGDVDGLQILFPGVMNLGQAPKAKTLPLILAANPLVQRLVLPLPLLFISFIPSFFLLLVLRIATQMPLPGLRSTFDFITTPGAPLNAAFLAREEFAQMKGMEPGVAAAVKDLKARGGSLRSYWARGDEDPWAPSGHRRDLEQALGLRTVMLPPHLQTSAQDISAATRPYRGSPASLRSRSFQIGGTITRAAGKKISNSRFGSRSRRGGPVSPGGPGSPGATSTTPSLSRSRTAGSSSALRQVDPSSPAGSPLRSRSTNILSPTMSSSGQRPSPYRRRPSISQATAKRSFDGSITLELPHGEDWGYLENGLPSDIEESEEGLSAVTNGAGAGGRKLFAQSPSASESKENPLVSSLNSPSKAKTLQDIFTSSSSPTTAPPSADAQSKAEAASSSLAPSLDLRSSSSSTTKNVATATQSAETKSPLVTKSARRERDADDLLSSTVCSIGMPHAFCLRYGREMARISAYWINEDYL